MEGIDPAGKKRIGFNRFMPVFETVKGASKPMTFEDYVEGMKVFDRDLVGYLNSGELRHLLTFMGMLSLFVHTFLSAVIYKFN